MAVPPSPPLPPAFVARMETWLGSEWPQLRDALDGTALRAVRLHRVSAQPQQRLGDTDPRKPMQPQLLRQLPVPPAVACTLLDAVPWTSDAFYIDAEAPLGKLVYHELGAYYLQEPSAMAVVEALDPQPGERILDLCAAPGGKTTAIAKRMQGAGLLAANEIHPTRVRILGQNIERLGVAAVITNESPDRLAANWAAEFDAILVDAPCSGEGMFRKDPGARQTWSPESVATCTSRQRDILTQAVTMMRPGGRLVYSTCTLNPEENEQMVAWLRDTLGLVLLPLPQWPQWDTARPEWADDSTDIAHARRLWPHRGRGEGHFVALLQKPGDRSGHATGPQRTVRRTPGSNARPTISGRLAREWQAWLQDVTAGATVPDKWRAPLHIGDSLFTDETGALPLHGLRVLRPGVCLATFKGDRFEPHQQWAMAVQGQNGANPLAQAGVGISAVSACQYFAGMALAEVATAGGKSQRGHVWVHVDGLPAGWGKLAPGRINNLYPKGLRRTDLRAE